MKKITCLLILFFCTWPAHAMPLPEALAKLYETNPTLQAKRAELRGVDENVPVALANTRPSLSLSGDIARKKNESIFSNSHVTSRDVTATLSQPLYRGGRTTAAIDRAENEVLSARADLAETEQTILGDGITAYMNLWRDAEEVKLNEHNVNVLTRQLDATTTRFEVGELTRTDVAQSKSRLARAKAALVGARAKMAISLAAFEKIFGLRPQTLTDPVEFKNTPATPDEAINAAQKNAFRLKQYEYLEQAAVKKIDEVAGEALPEISVEGTANKNWENFSANSEGESFGVGARMNVPLYQGGAVAARVRQAKEEANQARIQIEETRREVVETVISAWENYASAQAQIVQYDAEVEASALALEGVQAESDLGERTVLDVLNAEQEFLTANTNLTRAKRDRVVTYYNLLAAMGQLTAQNLGFAKNIYDPTQNYQKSRDTWFSRETE